jgi:hypothetical protein
MALLTMKNIIDGLNDETYFPEGTEIEMDENGQYLCIEKWLCHHLNEDEIKIVISRANLPYTIDEIMGRPESDPYDNIVGDDE